MRAFGVVVDEEGVEVLLHGLDGLVPVLSAGDPEVFIQQGAVQALDEAVALRSSDPGGAMFDALQLKEEFVRVPVRPAAELPAVVAQDGGDLRIMLLEEGQDVVVDDLAFPG